MIARGFREKPGVRFVRGRLALAGGSKNVR